MSGRSPPLLYTYISNRHAGTPEKSKNKTETIHVCAFSSHSFWTSMDVPAGVTQEEGHTGFFIHFLSVVRAFIFLARRIQPFLSLVDREVEFCVRFNRSPLVGHFYFYMMYFFSEKNPVCRDRTHVPTCQKVTRLPLSYRGDQHHQTW